MEAIKKSYMSFREYIDALKRFGDVFTVDQEVDWNLEMGAMIRYAYEFKPPRRYFATSRTMLQDFGCWERR